MTTDQFVDAAEASARDRVERHQVAHLYVLIGENPLPAFVAARTLLKPNGTLHPVYTSRTAAVLDRLRECVTNNPNNKWSDERKERCWKPVALNDYETDAYHITEAIKASVTHLLDIEHVATSDIGLNYTGGTAPMGVHSYNTLRSLCPNAVFSYLDPRRLEMCIDRTTGGRVRCKVDHVLVKFDDILALHGLRRVLGSGVEHTVLVTAACELAALQGDDQCGATQYDNWITWKKAELYERGKRGRGPNAHWKTEAELRNIVLNLALLSEEHQHILRTHFGASATTLSLRDLVAHGGFGDHGYEASCKWLDGVWLETYVFAQVRHLAGPIGRSAQSVHIPHPTITRDELFEFDVAFVRGYQLYGLSCTTSSEKKLCKTKLLEAYVRVRQLGGDEARMALVCMSNDVGRLKTELTPALSNSKIEVFGRTNLPALKDEIQRWVDRNS